MKADAGCRLDSTRLGGIYALTSPTRLGSHRFPFNLSPGTPAASPARRVGSPSSYSTRRQPSIAVNDTVRHHVPERLFLREQLLPLLVDLALDLELDLPKLHCMSAAFALQGSHKPTFSSSLRSCSSLRRTLCVASSSGRIDESLERVSVHRVSDTHRRLTGYRCARSGRASRYGKSRRARRASTTSSPPSESWMKT